jgi:hypothetical protein
MPRIRFWNYRFRTVSLLAISWIDCVAQAPTVEPVTDRIRDRNGSAVDCFRYRRRVGKAPAGTCTGTSYTSGWACYRGRSNIL